jgi:nucleoside phosphorylase
MVLDAPPLPLLIVTTTQVEVQAVLNAFTPGKKSNSLTLDNMDYYDLGTHRGVPVFMVQSEKGSGTPGGALITVSVAIEKLKPQAVVMCGIAFGMCPEEQNLGEILIAQQLQLYEPQKRELKQNPIIRGDCVTASDRLLKRVRNGEISWKETRVHFGLFLSGEKLVNDPVVLGELKKMWPEAIGGDMEGAGLYVSARHYKVDWILVKAISDWADGAKKDGAQPLAARNAAEFVRYVIQLSDWGGVRQGISSEIQLESPLHPAVVPRLVELGQAGGTKVAPVDIPSNEHVPFTNRQDELNELTAISASGQCYAVNAPPGYGKTDLMKQVEERFKENGWDCGRAELNSSSTMEEVANSLSQKLEIKLNPDLKLSWGLRFSGELRKKYDSKAPIGVALIIDLNGQPTEELLKDLLENFIPQVRRTLMVMANFYSRQSLLRIILAGRYLNTSDAVREAQIKERFILYPLSPFTYDVVVQSTQRYLPNNGSEWDDLAAHILFLTGGHPGCTAYSLELFRSAGLSLADFLELYTQDIRQKVSTVTQAIVDVLVAKDPNLFLVVTGILSLLRYVDNYAVQDILEFHPECNVRDHHDLWNRLKGIHLLEKEPRFLEDSIARRLLACRLRDTPFQSGRYEELKTKARKICLRRISPESRSSPIERWVVEFLYQSLQPLNQGGMKERSARQLLRQRFFEQTVPEAMDHFLFNRDISEDDWSVEINALLTEMNMDRQWEFRFVVNYYLTDEHFTNEPFEELQRQIFQYNFNKPPSESLR